jgi:recombination protein RecA
MGRPKTQTDELKKQLTTPRKQPVWKTSDRLSSGSTLLNLACSDNYLGGFPLGGYIFLVGDSRSGKTWLSLSCMAEAAIDERFNEHRFIYDNVERGVKMDLARYFGQAMADRIEPPRLDADGQPLCSTYTEEFYFNLDSALNDDRPFIYVLDSMDGLDTLADEEKFQKWKEGFETGKNTAGSFGASKAKLNSVNLRRVMGRLEQSNSLLIVISQTRDNISPMSYATKTRSGGHALQFFATLEIWSSVVKKLTKTHKGTDRHIGSLVKLLVKKNRLTGRELEVIIPIYHSYGIDDLGSCVDYMTDEKAWERSKVGVIVPAGLKVPDAKYKRESLIQAIETHGLQDEVRKMVQGEWQAIAEAVALKREPRYK